MAPAHKNASVDGPNLPVRGCQNRACEKSYILTVKSHPYRGRSKDVFLFFHAVWALASLLSAPKPLTHTHRVVHYRPCAVIDGWLGIAIP
jgi:hypothetical protein